MTFEATDRIRLFNLLSDRALFGIPAGKKQELNELLARFQDEDPEIQDRIAALIAMSGSDQLEPLPMTVANKIRNNMVDARSPGRDRVPETEESARSVVFKRARQRQQPILSASSQSPDLFWTGLLAAGGWITTAALLLVLVFSRPVGVFDQEPTVAMNQLIATAGDVMKQDWVATDDPAAGVVSGAVLWSNQAQEGYMRFTGLRPNNPQQSQFQLWIVDANQEDPIDGGVFDFPDEGGEVVIPIDAKLTVVQPTAFVVTMEQPGGVPKSRLERVVLTSQKSM